LLFLDPLPRLSGLLGHSVPLSRPQVRLDSLGGVGGGRTTLSPLQQVRVTAPKWVQWAKFAEWAIDCRWGSSDTVAARYGSPTQARSVSVQRLL
jgi:uncharacterized protein (DUF2235 family)